MFASFHGKFSSEPSRVPNKSHSLYLFVLLLTTGLIFSISIYAKPLLLAFAQNTPASPVTTQSPVLHANSSSTNTHTVVGFLPYWMLSAHPHIYPEYLDQIIFFGIGVNEKGELIRQYDDGNPATEWSILHSPEFNNIRNNAAKTNTRILVSIKNFDNASIDALISNPTASARAINQIISLIKTLHLDGVDLNFEYFSATDFPTMQYMNAFVTDLRTQLNMISPDLLLSFDVNASVVYNDKAYDMVKIGEQVDQVILMGYDFTRADARNAGSVAPLYASGNTPSISYSISSMIGRVPREKIVLGVPLYGYEWQTFSTAYGSHTIPDTGALATYGRIRDLISHHEVSISYDDFARTPRLVYTLNGIHQIYYDDERSLKEKIDFAKDKELKGIALWALGYEGAYTEPWVLIKNQIKSGK